MDSCESSLTLYENGAAHTLHTATRAMARPSLRHCPFHEGGEPKQTQTLAPEPHLGSRETFGKRKQKLTQWRCNRIGPNRKHDDAEKGTKRSAWQGFASNATTKDICLLFSPLFCKVFLFLRGSHVCVVCFLFFLPKSG